MTTNDKTIIQSPTVGRQVWFYPNAVDTAYLKADGTTDDKPFAATVCHVWGDRCVNLQVLSRTGEARSHLSVLLLQGDETYNPARSYCTWMPYQAKKHAEDTAKDAAGLVRTQDLASFVPRGAAREATHDRANDAFAASLGKPGEPSLAQRMDDGAKPHLAVTEAELKAKSKGARVTMEDVDKNIAHVYYHVPPNTTLTLCVLTLENGFTVTGESACADPSNFDPGIGQRIAYENAKNKIWALMGYALRDTMALAGMGGGNGTQT